jgi:hypothetical protein
MLIKGKRIEVTVSFIICVIPKLSLQRMFYKLDQSSWQISISTCIDCDPCALQQNICMWHAFCDKGHDNFKARVYNYCMIHVWSYFFFVELRVNNIYTETERDLPWSSVIRLLTLMLLCYNFYTVSIQITSVMQFHLILSRVRYSSATVITGFRIW